MSAEIEFVASSGASAAGEYGTTGDRIDRLTIDIPADVEADDVLHVIAMLPQAQFVDRPGTQSRVLRQYSFLTPVGWRLVARGSSGLVRASSVQVFRRIATSADEGDGYDPVPLDLLLNETRYRANPPADGEVLHPTAILMAHRGVSGVNPVPAGYHIGRLDERGQFTKRNELDVPVSVAVNTKAPQPWFEGQPGWDVPGVGEQFPTAVAAVTLSGVTWELIEQQRPAAVATRFDYGQMEEWFPPDGLRRVMPQISAWHTFNAAAGQLMRLAPPYPRDEEWLADLPRYRVTFILAEGTSAPPVGDVPIEGLVGVTGSGWVIPEYEGRVAAFGPAGSFAASPLLHQVDTEQFDEYGLREVIEDPNVRPEANPCLALDAQFNAVGACLTATAIFPESPGLPPFTAAMRFRFGEEYGEEERLVWWAGVIRNTREVNGLHAVELDGFWSLFNDGRVTVDEAGAPALPIVPGVLEGTIILPGGQEVETVPDGEARQQAWSDYWQRIYEEIPEAAWGIGPDGVFIRGLSNEAGVIELDALGAAVVSVQDSGMILPPVVTQWWGVAGGNVLEGESLEPPLLAPRRVQRASVEDGNLIPPAESVFPLSIGPSYTIEYAGFCVPPVRVNNLPNGESQMAASARVVIKLGEEGSMPSIVTTLTTAALPFARDRRP